MTLEMWISTHPYLKPLEAFQSQVVKALNGISGKCAQIPDWDLYADDYNDGLPLLHCAPAVIDGAELEKMVASLLKQLAAMPLPEPLKSECLELRAQFQSRAELLRQAVVALLCNPAFPLSQPGLFRLLGWATLAHHLHPLLASFENWRDEESWLQRYCPVCGSGPSMSQLVGMENGRRRVLICGCCGTGWPFRRMGCPFCENGNDHRLSVLAVEGERELRIDYCNSCSGYLKTYDGKGSESVMLADWTSLHLDLLAQDRGLRRLATSLYDL